jgi:hypothetical protein
MENPLPAPLKMISVPNTAPTSTPVSDLGPKLSLALGQVLHCPQAEGQTGPQGQVSLESRLKINTMVFYFCFVLFFGSTGV